MIIAISNLVWVLLLLAILTVLQIATCSWFLNVQFKHLHERVVWIETRQRLTGPNQLFDQDAESQS